LQSLFFRGEAAPGDMAQRCIYEFEGFRPLPETGILAVPVNGCEERLNALVA
jgi:hypothetical protein